MLRINLLPIRQLKKRAKATNQIAAAAVVFIAVLVLLALVGALQAGKISALNEDIAAKQKEKQSFDKVIQELAELEKKRLDLNNKINIINQLKADSSLTVRVLDEVARIIDNKRMWLTQLTQSGGSLTISGYALDNQTVATFMDNLKAESPFIVDVNLTNSSLSQVAGKDLKSFALTCSVAAPQPAAETDQAQPEQK